MELIHISENVTICFVIFILIEPISNHLFYVKQTIIKTSGTANILLTFYVASTWLMNHFTHIILFNLHTQYYAGNTIVIPVLLIITLMVF